MKMKKQKYSYVAMQSNQNTNKKQSNFENLIFDYVGKVNQLLSSKILQLKVRDITRYMQKTVKIFEAISSYPHGRRGHCLQRHYPSI